MHYTPSFSVPNVLLFGHGRRVYQPFEDLLLLQGTGVRTFHAQTHQTGRHPMRPISWNLQTDRGFLASRRRFLSRHLPFPTITLSGLDGHPLVSRPAMTDPQSNEFVSCAPHRTLNRADDFTFRKSGSASVAHRPFFQAIAYLSNIQHSLLVELMALDELPSGTCVQ